MAMSASASPLGVGAAKGANLVVQSLQERPDLLLVATHPRVELPLFDGVRAV